MKVILTGVTGFIGSEVLAHCQEDQTITSIILLARQPLPETLVDDPKVEAIVVEDFNVYSEAVIKKMEGADACIWYFFPRSPLDNRIQCFLFDCVIRRNRS